MIILHNYNGSNNSAVLEPRTGQFSRTGGFEAKANDLTFEAKAEDFKMCPRERPQGQGRPRGVHLWQESLIDRAHREGKQIKNSKMQYSKAGFNAMM